MRKLDQLTAADFRPLVGQAFRLEYPGHAEDLKLIEVSSDARIPPPGFRSAFSVLFEGASRDVMLGQSIYALQHADIGQLELLLVPVGRLPEGNFRYEAVFS